MSSIRAESGNKIQCVYINMNVKQMGLAFTMPDLLLNIRLNKGNDDEKISF